MARTIGPLLLGALLAAPAGAAGLDLSQPVLCAVTEAVECGPQGNCMRGGADEIDLPSFVEIDLAAKQIRERGGERKTAIRSQSRADGHLVLQGVQEGRAWSVSLAEASGRMTLTASAPGAGFVVFGVCTGL